LLFAVSRRKSPDVRTVKSFFAAVFVKFSNTKMALKTLQNVFEKRFSAQSLPEKRF
jgi:hypothetical protein